MKFSYSWLKELVKFKESPEKLAELLTLYLAETKVSVRGKRFVLDVDLLPNRVADASNHLGLALEISAILGKKFNYSQPKFKEEKQTTKSLIKVAIKSPYCRRYVARIIQNVKVESSPQWLKERIEDCGLRPINNIVDAANYAMLLTGQPLHVFDFQKIAFNKDKKKEIIIRQAKKGEQITTLERQLYKLKENNLLVCDSEQPLAIAGIKGGLIAEVDKDTSFIVIESANFDGINIHLTSRELGLKTDASWRFEHHLKSDLTVYAVDILAQIIQQVAGGEILKGKIDAINCSSHKKPIQINFNSWEKFLGWSISKAEIIKKLKLLGFNLIERQKYLLVAPPLYRNDIESIEDVIGEIARLQGFNQISSLSPKEEVVIPIKNKFWEFKEKIKDWLKAYHLEEVYNYSLISQKDKEALDKDWQNKLIALENPISDLFCYLQPTLLLNFLKNIKANFRFVEKLKLFEIGKIYHCDIKEKEETVFSGIFARKEKILTHPLFYEVKGIIEGLFIDLGIDKNDYSIKSIEETEYFSILEKGMAFYVKNQLLGVLAMPKKNLFRKYDVEGEVVFWEIKLLALMALEHAERKYQSLPQYPAAIRDISFIIKKDILIDEILRTIQNNDFYLEDADLFDIYEGKNLPSGKQSLSFHLIFRSSKKTLKAEEIDEEMKKIYQALQKLGAEIR
ncbi:MAG: phenylalanine--tRNA ligase subunit beta [Candidatus Paceibacterota bacterium]|jgi:phenylalanyl-tRNA synthetase beta chain